MHPTTMAHTLTRTIALVVAMVVGSLGAYAQQPMPSGIYTNAAQNTDGIHSAIKANVDSAPYLFRSVVRKGLLEICPAYRRISIQQTDGEIVVTFDSEKPLHIPADGSAIKWTNEEGDHFDVSATWQDGRLIQVFKGRKSRRVNTFIFGADHQALTLDVVIVSEQLKAPINYELMFRHQ